MAPPLSFFHALLFVLGLSFFTFVAFFGRLPTFRNTPIGSLHRLLWIHLPRSFSRLDHLLTHGRVSRGGSRFFHHLFYDAHPYVLIFYLSLLTSASLLFLTHTFFLLPRHHQVLSLLILPLPYLSTYLACTRTPFLHPTLPSPLYPPDYIHYHPPPLPLCRTCLRPKPPRSKHCALCRACVARADHHCIWLNTCLGAPNYKYFLLLLLSLTLLLLYGARLAHLVLAPQIHHATATGGGGNLGTRLLRALTLAVRLGGLPIAGVGLLALLTAPLPAALLAYHVYLVWTGMTTNEAAKWEDLAQDLAAGASVWVGELRRCRRRRRHLDGDDEGEEEEEEAAKEPWERDAERVWGQRARFVVLRTTDGNPPGRLPEWLRSRGGVDPACWRRVRGLAELENVYDRGFWANLEEVLWH